MVGKDDSPDLLSFLQIEVAIGACSCSTYVHFNWMSKMSLFIEKISMSVVYMYVIIIDNGNW